MLLFLMVAEGWGPCNMQTGDFMCLFEVSSLVVCSQHINSIPLIMDYTVITVKTVSSVMQF